MEKNIKLWKKARLSLCSSFLRIIRKPCLISLKVKGEAGTQTIDLTEAQAERVIDIIKQDLKLIV